MEPQDKPFEAGEVVWHKGLGFWVQLVERIDDDRWTVRFPDGLLSINREQRYFLRSLPPIPKGFKRKVKKEVKAWVNVYEWGTGVSTFATRELANDNAATNRITCVELTGTYEIEEDVT